MKKQKLFKNRIKSAVTVLVCTVAVLLSAFIFVSCKNNGDLEPDGAEQVDADGAVLISTSEELKAFFESGTHEKAKLTASVDIGDEMLTLTQQRKSITIDGASNTLTGAADCVIRLENNTTLTLNNINVIGAKDVIGCMQDAAIAGVEMTLRANMSAVRSDGVLAILDNSSINAESNMGYGIIADSVEIGNASKITVTAENNAVNILRKQLVLSENAVLDATTRSDYSAVKCTGTLVLNNGAIFTVKNEGEYHGAQADFIEINGDVTINANGGKRGAGIFLFQLEEDYTVKGHCKNALRKENGHGSIEFSGE